MNLTYADILLFIASIIVNFVVSFYSAGRAMGKYTEKLENLQRECNKIPDIAGDVQYILGRINGGT